MKVDITMIKQEILLLFLLCPVMGELDIAVHVEGGRAAADILAARHAMQNLGEIIPDTNYYLLRRVEHSRQRRSVRNLSHVFDTDYEVDWAEVQTHRVRVKRDPVYGSGSDYYDYSDMSGRIIADNLLHNEPWSEMNDPMWKDMWYLNRREDLNMRVEGAWSLGVTGLGIAVTILDDGIEKSHPDLIRNYDPLASTDVNGKDHDPSPRYDSSGSNRHGTRCAGVVAATRNNSLCGVGIAFNAKIGGIRMLDGSVSDWVEAKSLSFNTGHIDIYSSSWGPNDDGKTVDGPGKLTSMAFEQGVHRGRDGKGSIFVWASGNGGRDKDNCNCDGYAASVFTITVSSTSESGHIPWYSEPCSATIATTYSSGSSTDRQIVTTDLHGQCTSKLSGTSASAPITAAIIALTLEANPGLTWRDVQHIMVRTARPGNLKAPDWKVNGVNRTVSHSYGYGLMDAHAMVKLARKWNSVPNQQSCEVASPHAYKVIPAMGQVTIELDVVSCPGVRFLEHVVSPIFVTSGRKRGDLRIYLQSPSGTWSTLLDNRPKDFSSLGFINWPFMTTHVWGENPIGKWILYIHNDADSKGVSDAKFFDWSLKLYGTQSDTNSDRPADRAGDEETAEDAEKLSLDIKSTSPTTKYSSAGNTTSATIR
eukprot:GFUD01015303.1.p1 GENE.GFUD01015303.1~~GFUD01015303.1.p1  ORF type:complete len:647 (+),score=141.20 GFUD01015303.1:124-2064(+)